MAKKEPGSAAMLVLALLKSREMYGYEIIEELEIGRASCRERV